MNKNISKNILIAVFVSLIAGCVKDANNIKLPETEAKLVVGCFISPQDSMIVVTLTRSNPIFGKNHNSSRALNNVVDAEVTIFNGTNTINIPYNNGYLDYEIASSLFPITSGTTYQIKVSTPQNEHLSASCTVPLSTVSSVDIEVDTLSRTKKVILKWQDIPNETNYYQAVGFLIISDTFNGDTTHTPMGWNYNHLANDQDRDGSQLHADLEYDFYGHYDSKIIGFGFYLMNTDVEYYKYQKSINNYGGDNPFSEPTPVYSNIKGGLGIFCAFQKFYIRKS